MQDFPQRGYFCKLIIDTRQVALMDIADRFRDEPPKPRALQKDEVWAMDGDCNITVASLVVSNVAVSLESIDPFVTGIRDYSLYQKSTYARVSSHSANEMTRGELQHPKECVGVAFFQMTSPAIIARKHRRYRTEPVINLEQ